MKSSKPEAPTQLIFYIDISQITMKKKNKENYKKNCEKKMGTHQKLQDIIKSSPQCLKK